MFTLQRLKLPSSLIHVPTNHQCDRKLAGRVSRFVLPTSRAGAVPT
jgi:hypothetical protein